MIPWSVLPGLCLLVLSISVSESSPEALNRWAEELGCEIVVKEVADVLRNLRDAALTLRVSQHLGNLPADGSWIERGVFYRLLGRRRALYWGVPFSPETCPIRVEWDGPEPKPIKPRRASSPATRSGSPDRRLSRPTRVGFGSRSSLYDGASTSDHHRPRCKATR